MNTDLCGYAKRFDEAKWVQRGIEIMYDNAKDIIECLGGIGKYAQKDTKQKMKQIKIRRKIEKCRIKRLHTHVSIAIENLIPLPNARHMNARIGTAMKMIKQRKY